MTSTPKTSSCQNIECGEFTITATVCFLWAQMWVLFTCLKNAHVYLRFVLFCSLTHIECVSCNRYFDCFFIFSHWFTFRKSVLWALFYRSAELFYAFWFDPMQRFCSECSLSRLFDSFLIHWMWHCVHCSISQSNNLHSLHCTFL